MYYQYVSIPGLFQSPEIARVKFVMCKLPEPKFSLFQWSDQIINCRLNLTMLINLFY